MSLPPIINGKFSPKPELVLEPMQLCTMLVLDSVCVALQTGANQLGGFLKLEREASLLAAALKMVSDGKEKLMGEWQRKIQVVPAAALVKPE